MIVHRSNRTEVLVDALAELVRVPPADPFAPETIVVQGRGMARWLGLELAARLGIWANPSFPFPRAFIEQVATAVLGEPAGGAAVFTPEGLRWAVAAELLRQASAARFAPVQRFLRDDRDGSRLLPLAARIADLFDQYAVFRPEMVLTWENGGGDPTDWQPALWRALVARLGPLHQAARARALLAALRAGVQPATPLPHRASIFGLATLPPIYVDLLAALDGRIELHLFALSPSRAYWGDLPSARERRRALAAGGDPAELYLDAPPLLASLGRVGRDFQQVFESRLSYEDDPVDRYREPGEGSLLATLQSDVLDLRLRGAAGEPPIVLAADDGSVAVHACHGPMREMEVLHDRLSALFAADPTLRPHDVIVMTPSIDTYAPLVEAVFTSPDRPRIPFTIADRRARATRDVVDAFLRTLDLLAGRLPASGVLDLLALDAVRQRFAIPAEALDTIRGWIDEAGVRWGADAAHRVEEGLPACGDNTWRFGLDRLLLGTALPSSEESLWQGALPSGDLEGSEAELLGQFVAFVETLMRFRRLLATPHTAVDWRDRLGELLAAVAQQKPSYADQHDAVLAALALLAERAAQGGFEDPIGLTAIRRLLDTALAVEGAPLGFLTGAVTFCEMVPMRTVPFRVVALVGLSDGVFPRAPRPLAFDLMARAPRPGDRTPRDDDRYLFLEALLSARERLLITYAGHSITNNAELPPSVVVSELLDAIDATAQLPAVADAPRKARTAVVHHHPLQPFSPVAFRGPGPLASYARSQYAGALALCGQRQPLPPFISAPLPLQPVTAVTLDELLDFFRNPMRWFLRRRLQLYLPFEERASRRPRAHRALLSSAVGPRAALVEWPAGRRRGRRDRGAATRQRHPAARHSGAGGRGSAVGGRRRDSRRGGGARDRLAAGHLRSRRRGRRRRRDRVDAAAAGLWGGAGAVLARRGGQRAGALDPPSRVERRDRADRDVGVGRAIEVGQQATGDRGAIHRGAGRRAPARRAAGALPARPDRATAALQVGVARVRGRAAQEGRDVREGAYQGPPGV